MYNYTIDDITKLTQVPIEKNKRNRRGRKQHVKVMSAVRDAIYPDGTWRNKNGRPKGSRNKENRKKELIIEYAATHPEANVTDIARALGVSRPTVYKYLEEKEVKNECYDLQIDGLENLVEKIDTEEHLKMQQLRLRKYLEYMNENINDKENEQSVEN
jgi:DNA-binding transcriptional ArsR family regulator